MDNEALLWQIGMPIYDAVVTERAAAEGTVTWARRVFHDELESLGVAVERPAERSWLDRILDERAGRLGLGRSTFVRDC